MRIPLPGVLTRSDRGQQRRISLGHARCLRCNGRIALDDRKKVCYDDGKDAHILCSVTRNRELVKMRAELAYDDYVMKGSTCPVRSTRLSPLRRLGDRSPIQQAA
jgi:recombinational DNA repair protein RecR